MMTYMSATSEQYQTHTTTSTYNTQYTDTTYTHTRYIPDLGDSLLLLMPALLPPGVVPTTARMLPLVAQRTYDTEVRPVSKISEEVSSSPRDTCEVVWMSMWRVEQFSMFS